MVKNILQMLEESARRFPDKPAFSDDTGSVSYAETVKMAKAAASRLPVSGRHEHRAVAVMMEKGKMTPVAFMAAVYAGCFYIPVDTEMPSDRIAKIFATVQPAAVFADEENFEKACSLHENVIRFDEAVQCSTDEARLEAVRFASIDTDPVYALFTSGSTGTPKGVVCCHRSVIDYADWLIDTFCFDENTVFGSQTPFYFSMSVLDLYATIRSGAELHVIPKKFFAFPVRLLEYLNETKINTVYWVPTALCIPANMKALDKVSLPYLKKILFAGEAMPNKQLNIWRKHIPDALYANLFGPTEITDIGIYYIVDREFSDDEPLPIGKKCDNVDFLVLGEDNLPVPDGEMGELCIRGSFLSLGYYDDPAKTAESFIQNPLNPHYPELIYKTGDLVSLNAYGELEYHGRRDFQIKHRGNRIELGEIENAVAAVPGIIASACVYDRDKERIVLFYQGENVTTQVIRETMSERVPNYMIPNAMICLDALPENRNGKIDRTRLLQMFRDKSYLKK